MLKMGARYADGIMVSDFTAPRLRWARRIIDAVLREADRDPASFPLVNFWAWHVKPTREEAHREARFYLMARGTIWEPYIHDVVTSEEAAIVKRHYPAFVRAYRHTDAIEGVPPELVGKIVDRGVAASAEADVGVEIAKLRALREAGMTRVALCLYNDPEYSIHLIGRQVVPALRDD
jgi:alkanesulfonate monooxygenase SsuD/methylene tetrahydromethanopterin reductase-like flavin-dependent oxidoreductase (luciferase family)